MIPVHASQSVSIEVPYAPSTVSNASAVLQIVQLVMLWLLLVQDVGGRVRVPSSWKEFFLKILMIVC